MFCNYSTLLWVHIIAPPKSPSHNKRGKRGDSGYNGISGSSLCLSLQLWSNQTADHKLKETKQGNMENRHCQFNRITEGSRQTFLTETCCIACLNVVGASCDPSPEDEFYLRSKLPGWNMRPMQKCNSSTVHLRLQRESSLIHSHDKKANVWS